MKILVVHLSDIHLQFGSANTILNKTEKIKGIIMNNAIMADRVLICITGDTVFSGTKEQFGVAKKIIADIRGYIEKERKVEVPIIVVSGNHDCDFDNHNKAREAVINSVLMQGDAAIDDDVIDLCSNVHNAYHDFQDELVEDCIFSNKIFYKKKIELSESYSILFNCYNTSLMSTIKENQGGLYYPIDLIDENIMKDNKASIIISLFHHPKGWLQTNNARKFFKKIETTSDIALSGHEHSFSKTMTDNFEGNSFLYVEGGVLQEQSNPNSSAFNLIFLDLVEEKIKIHKCQWKNHQYSYAGDDTDYISYKTKLGKFKNEYDFSETHIDWLDSPGANFRHPNKDVLTLSDVFIYPNFRAMPIEGNDENIKVDIFPNSQSIIDELSPGFKMLLSGTENSGKTTLAKVFLRKCHSLELIPIYVDGSEIKHTGIEEFVKLVGKNFDVQYDKKLKGQYESLLPEKIAIIIDDFDKIRLNLKYKYRLLNTITNAFSNIIIIGNEVLLFEEFIDDDSLADETLSQYEHFEIAEFGHKLRYSLINKWTTLGNLEILSEEDRLRKNDSAQRIVNSIIGPNLIPAYPIFLLTILQTIEAGNPHDLKESSYGHYYQVLIIGSLGKLIRSNDRIDEYYMYLSEMANFFYVNKYREASMNELETFHAEHCSNYKLRLNFLKTIEVLKNSQLIDVVDNNINFRYKYIYYFFVAKYISDNLYKAEIREQIIQMCRTLHNVHSANVILFLTHHSKDIFIIEEIIKVARSQFEQYSNANLENDIHLVNQLINEAPKFVLRDNNINQHRNDLLEEKDAKEATIVGKTKKLVDYDEVESIDDSIDVSASLNVAFKTLEITGQVLKNHYASFQGDRKVELAQEAYSIGLRLIALFFDVYANSSDYIKNQITQVLDNLSSSNKEKIDNTARNIVFQIASRTTYNILKRTAMAVGSEKLQEVFDDVKANNNTNAVNIIDFQIHTEFYNGFPISLLEKLSKRFDGNYLATSILKKTVIDYLYLYPTSTTRKQQICSILNISMQTQRYLEGVSSDIKG